MIPHFWISPILASNLIDYFSGGGNVFISDGMGSFVRPYSGVRSPWCINKISTSVSGDGDMCCMFGRTVRYRASFGFVSSYQRLVMLDF
jgi:hypothetical protein